MTTYLYKQPKGYPTQYSYKLIPPAPSNEEEEYILLTSLSVSSLRYLTETVSQVPMITRKIWLGLSEKPIEALEELLPEEWELVEVEPAEDKRYPYCSDPNDLL